jgi:hypothetical protein
VLIDADGAVGDGVDRRQWLGVRHVNGLAL